MEQMTFSLFFQSLINGLNQGAIYALIALGYTMVYGIIRMINFAHGDFIMIGAYTLFYTIPLMVNAWMPAWLSVIVAIAVCALVGVLVETFAYRPVRKAGPMSALITALAMSIFLENLAMVLFGAKPHNVQAIFSLPTITVGSVALPLNDFAAVCKAFADFDVVLFFYEGGGAPLREVLHPGQYKRVAIVTGSEGGFSVEEAEAAKAADAVTVGLGPRILRCETAPLAALTSVMLLTGNLE